MNDASDNFLPTIDGIVSMESPHPVEQTLVLVWQDQGGCVWTSYTDPEFLARRYAIPDGLIANIRGIVALVDDAIHKA